MIIFAYVGLVTTVVYCGNNPQLSIVGVDGYWWTQLCTRYLLLAAIDIDRRYYESIVDNNGHRWIACTIDCGRQWISIDTPHNKRSPAMAIDGHSTAQSSMIDNINR